MATSSADNVPPEKLLLLVKKDLAQRLDVPSNSISLESFQPVTWPDGSMGCPQPGMEYTEGLVQGYRLIVRSGDKLYVYDTDTGSKLILCSEVCKKK
jgi:hypothetical protein